MKLNLDKIIEEAKNLQDAVNESKIRENKMETEDIPSAIHKMLEQKINWEIICNTINKHVAETNGEDVKPFRIQTLGKLYKNWCARHRTKPALRKYRKAAVVKKTTQG